MTSYSVTIIETVEFSGLTSDKATLTDTVSLASGAFATQYRSATLTNGVGVAPTLATKYVPAPFLFDGLGVGVTLAPTIKYGVTLSDLMRIIEATSVARPVTASETIGIASALTLKTAVVVAERLGLARTVNALLKYTASISDGLRVVDALGRFMRLLVSDTLGVAQTLTPLYRPVATLTQGVGLHDAALAPKLLFALVADETIGLNDIDILRIVQRGAIADGVRLTAGYVSPNGNMTAWAVNTRTGAVTEYQNYSFNSFAQSGHKFLGATSGGLYELDGDDDAGTDIIAKIASGYTQFGGAHLTSFKAAYLGLRGGGDDFVFKLVTADGRTYTYSVRAQEMQTTKILLGKGLRARYFAFELENTGQDFDLESVEFIPLVAQRRV